jgi:hypothetical protein
VGVGGNTATVPVNCTDTAQSRSRRTITCQSWRRL